MRKPKLVKLDLSNFNKLQNSHTRKPLLSGQERLQPFWFDRQIDFDVTRDGESGRIANRTQNGRGRSLRHWAWKLSPSPDSVQLGGSLRNAVQGK